MAVSSKFSPIGNDVMFFSTTGLVANGGKLFFYATGTTTKQNTYTTSAGTVANSNPIVLNSYGKSANQIWLPDGQYFDIVLAPADDTDPPASGVTLGTNISGINDTGADTAIDQWITSAAAPGYVSATSFTIGGDQTSIYHVGRRVKTTNTGGTVYSTITASAYASVTTVTVVNDSGTIDSGISAAAYSILTSVNPAIPKIALPDGSTGTTQAINDNSTKFATTAYVDSISNAVKARGSVRQSLIFAPVTSSGLPDLSGSTGSTTVTTSNVTSTAPFVVNAANGIFPDYIGVSTSNLSWTGLSTNGTMYLYVDVSSAGVLSTGSVTTAPVYQFGGTPSTTANVCTFNISQMQMFVGNGSTAPQTYRVFVGEVEVSGNVTTSITWYALNGYYDSGFTATIPSAATYTTKTHNIGVIPEIANLVFECTTIDSGYQVGDRIMNPTAYSGAGNESTGAPVVNRLSSGFQTGSAANSYFLIVRTTGDVASITLASWKYKLVISRGW